MRPQGTDGSDYAFRQTVVAQYGKSASLKASVQVLTALMIAVAPLLSVVLWHAVRVEALAAWTSLVVSLCVGTLRALPKNNAARLSTCLGGFALAAAGGVAAIGAALWTEANRTMPALVLAAVYVVLQAAIAYQGIQLRQAWTPRKRQ